MSIKKLVLIALITIVLLLGLVFIVLWKRSDRLTPKQRAEVIALGKPDSDNQRNDSVRINELEVRMDAIESKVTALESRVVAVEDNVVILGNELHGIDERLKIVEGHGPHSYDNIVLTFDTTRDFITTKVPNGYFIQIRK